MTELQAGHGDNRDQGVAQGVFADDDDLRQAFGARGTDIVRRQRIDHVDAGKPAILCNIDQRERGRREDEMLQHVDEIRKPSLRPRNVRHACDRKDRPH